MVGLVTIADYLEFARTDGGNTNIPQKLSGVKNTKPKLSVTTSFLVLMRLAYDVGRAKKSGNVEALAEAEKKLKEYEDLCKQADNMSLHLPKSAL